MAQIVKRDGRVNLRRPACRDQGALLLALGPWPAIAAKQQARAAGPANRKTAKCDCPSFVNTMCRDLPPLLKRTRSVPASGSKSSTTAAQSSP
jgi:hypothetical protein